MTVIQYLLLFFSVILGGSIAFFVEQNRKNILQLVLSFSGAYVLGITVLHLIPSVFGNPSKHTGLWILAGFFIQLLLDQLSQGVEHGHVHVHSKTPFRYAIQVMIGLSIHAFLEGMPLSDYAEFHEMHHHAQTDSVQHLLYGIILHKIPAAFALLLLLNSAKFPKRNAIICLIIFASMSPLGAIVSEMLHLNERLFTILLSIVVGSFLHISTTILFEMDDENHHYFSWKKLLAILTGTGLALLTIL
ncbi:MAG: ZIP family metal transporter [Bacteroidetes bacterium]|nr:ZIP family metal transporter [Bacteroidota bacterium]